MEVYFVRHGETDWNVERRMQGHSDTPLNGNGIAQAHGLAARMSGIIFDEVHSSPLSRAYNTARIICGNSAEIKTDARLRERSFGALEGLVYDEYLRRISEDASLLSNVEAREDAAVRAGEYFRELVLRRKTGRLLMVSHGGVFRALLYSLFGICNEEAHEKYPIPNCSFYIFRISNNTVSLHDHAGNMLVSAGLR